MFKKTARFYDALYASKDYASEAEHLRLLIERHRLPPGATLLDVACGTGMHAHYLKTHYTVDGLDLDEQMVAVARQRYPDLTFHHADMTAFDLGRTFDVVLCLFGSIGYAKTLDRMRQAVQTMARHVAPGGLLIVEPWLTPEAYRAGRLYASFVDQPDLKISRMNVSEVHGTTSVLSFHYLVGTPDGVDYFTERHELGLFTHDQYQTAFREAGLQVEIDEEGLTGRALYIGSQNS
ncbi:MAG: class I SAM-dependent DNA methyltransferase [Rhodothermales bacterium]